LFPKSAQVLGTHFPQTLPSQLSPLGQGAQVFCTPQRKLTGPQPVTRPASSASAQVIGVQQLPLSQVWPPPDAHVPHMTGGPQPLLTLPHVAPPHEGGEHAVHVPAWHVDAPAQPGHATVPLPHAFATVPQWAPASVASHSGGVVLQTPPRHCWPAVHDGQLRTLPQRSATGPHSVVPAAGEHVRGPHAAPASVTPASRIVSGVHWLARHSCPEGHPPQPMPTPHESVAITPHLPAHDGGLQLWDAPLPSHDCPFGQGLPHASVTPVHGSV
jgi:hypothetical protein